MNQIFPAWSCYAFLTSASWAIQVTREQKTVGNCWILSWKWRVAFDVWYWGLDLPALKRVEFGNNCSFIYFGIVELRSEWRVMWLEVDIAAFDCDNWPTHLLWNAWNIQIESNASSRLIKNRCSRVVWTHRQIEFPSLFEWFAILQPPNDCSNRPDSRLPTPLREGGWYERAIVHTLPQSSVHSHFFLFLSSRSFCGSAGFGATERVRCGAPVFLSSSNWCGYLQLYHQRLPFAWRDWHWVWFVCQLFCVLFEELYCNRWMTNRSSSSQITHCWKWSGAGMLLLHKGLRVAW